MKTNYARTPYHTYHDTSPPSIPCVIFPVQMKQVRLVRPEHEGAARSWRMRGLQKSARSVTPLGVAVLHNHEHIAKWLMG